MKKLLIALFLILVLLFYNFYICAQNQFAGISFFSPRSQGANNARRLSSWHCYRETDQSDSGRITILATPSYAHSQKAEHIAQALFGVNTIIIQGSQIPDRDTDSYVADYFGLSPKFASSVEIAPKIRNALVDLEFHATLGEQLACLYLQLNVPIVGNSRWHMELIETLLNGSQNSDFPINYMDETAVTPPINSFLQAWNGTVTYGQMQNAQKFGLLTCARSTHGIANLMATLGWHVALSDYGRFDLALQVTAPTGTRPDSTYFFEPIAGNGKHWQVGFDFAGDVLLWECEGDQQVRFFADVTFSTLCSTDQRRSFDLMTTATDPLYNNFGTRFLLLKEFDGVTYDKHLIPAINQTTLACDVRVDLEFDCAFMFSYQCRSMFLDLGYNGWIRSKEKISIDQCATIANLGIKGLQNVSISPGMVNNLTQSMATLFTTNTIPDMPSPQFLSQANLDHHSAASPRIMTHKLFFNLGCFGSWCDYDVTQPHVFASVGGEIEFQATNPRTSPRPVHATMSQWAVWTKFGYVFF